MESATDNQFMLTEVARTWSMTRAPTSPAATIKWIISILKGRFKKPPVRPTTTGVLAKPVSSILLISGGVAFACNYIKNLIDAVVRAFGIFGSMAVVLGVSAYGFYRLRNRHGAIDGQIVVEELVLIVASDVFAHEISRKQLFKFCETENVEVIVPVCVLEKLQKEMRAAGPEMNSTACIRMLKEQVRLGTVKLQTTAQEGLWISVVAGDEDFSYEQRIVRSAYIFSQLRSNATILILTNSKVLRIKAAAMNQRCIRTSEMRNLRIGD